MKPITICAAVGLAVLGAACANENPVQVPATDPEAIPTISDAARGGRAGFYFRAPISGTSTRTGPFDAGVEPIVDICVLGASGACSSTIATYTMNS